MLKLAVTVVVIGLAQQVLSAPTVESFLLNTLKERGTANVFVTMGARTTGVLKNIDNNNFRTRTEQLNAVHDSLLAFAARSQADALRLLQKESQNKKFSFESMWINNQIYIRDADLDTVQKLAALPEVESVAEEKFVHLDEPIDLKVYDNLPAADDDEIQWGVYKIEAPPVWNSGTDGKGIVIATIDTGCRGTHETLRDNHRKLYGWFDPSGRTAEPNDQNGHGTHTTANIAGTLRGVGVAPGAQWIACKGCQTSSCSQYDLNACGQWITCPTDTDGNNPDCSKAPNVVSNSWGGGRGNTWYRSVTEAWRAAGIIPLFSIGNSGPYCDTANSPGDEDNVIGVGSTTVDNIVSYFSSVGPTLIGQRIKPDVSAPGSNVFSAYWTSDTAYATMSGTSMACPHAAGTVALMLASSPNATVCYDTIKEALQTGSVPTTSEGKECSGIPDTTIPNHHIGYGRINARQSVARYVQLLKQKILSEPEA